MSKKKKNKKKRKNKRKEYVYKIDGMDGVVVSDMPPHEFKKFSEKMQQENESPKKTKWEWLLTVIIFVFLVYTVISNDWNAWIKTIAIISTIFIAPILTGIISIFFEGIYYRNPLALFVVCISLFVGIIWFGPLSSQNIWLKIVFTVVSFFASLKIAEILIQIKPPKKFWTSIPKEIREQAQNIINDFNQERFRRQNVAYIANFIDDGLFLDRKENDMTEPIARLGFQGKIDNWSFAIYKYSQDDYDPSEMFFPGSRYVDGTIQGAMEAGLLAYPLKHR